MRPGAAAMVMNDPTPHPRSATLDRLFEAAVELLGERGYSGATIDDIVERAGVAKGTVYYHFRSKSELVAALLDDGLRTLSDPFRAEIEGAENLFAAFRRHPAAFREQQDRHPGRDKVANAAQNVDFDVIRLR